MIRVLIVDDHALFRQGLRMVVEQESDIEVVGEAGSGAEAVPVAGTTKPDVVLMDVRMPGGGGIAACPAVLQAAPAARVVMLTISDEEDDLYNALTAGAVGCLRKDMSIEHIADAVRAVHDGKCLVSPSIASRLLRGRAAGVVPGGPAPAGSTSATRQQTEILEQLARGLDDSCIAQAMGVSEDVVRAGVRAVLAGLRERQLHRTVSG